MASRIHRISLRKSFLGTSWLPMLDRRADLITDVADATEVSGAGMALDRVKLDELGRFDARLPFGWEATEVCPRAWLPACRRQDRDDCHQGARAGPLFALPV